MSIGGSCECYKGNALVSGLFDKAWAHLRLTLVRFTTTSLILSKARSSPSVLAIVRTQLAAIARMIPSPPSARKILVKDGWTNNTCLSFSRVAMMSNTTLRCRVFIYKDGST